VVASRTQIALIAGLLIILGLGITAYKVLELGFPILPGESREVWTIESKASFVPADGPVDAQLLLPYAQNGWRLLEENFASSGFGFSVLELPSGERRARWTQAEVNGETTLYYKLQTYRSDRSNLPLLAAPTRVAVPRLEANQAVAVERLVSRLRAQSSDTASFVTLLIQAFNQRPQAQEVAFLLSNYDESSLHALQQVLAWAGVAAHRVRGVRLEDGRRRQRLSPLLEVYTGERWEIFDPVSAAAGLPRDFFVWQRGEGSVLDVMGGRDSRLEFALVRNTMPARSLVGMEQRAREYLLLDFSIYSLPVEQQGVFKGLLLIPVAALVVVFLRVIVGLRTSGTFMPILIALAFIQTTLLLGLAIFLVLVAAGLWIRSWLSHMNLLLVARISAVVIVVIGLMSALAVTSYKLGLHQVLTVTFFPTVILAWTIERMSILWEEEGPREVVIQGGGSLLVAVLAYLAMANTLVAHLTFNFPELMFSLLGLILLLGKYTGYRLTELYRFRDLGDES
jgi:hypothetical protein